MMLNTVLNIVWYGKMEVFTGCREVEMLYARKSGQPQYMLGMIRDITKRKQSEKYIIEAWKESAKANL